MAGGRFLISKDATGACRWVLRSADGAGLAESAEGYPDAKQCKGALEAFRSACTKAEVIDLTSPATVIKPKGIRKVVVKGKRSVNKKKVKR